MKQQKPPPPNSQHKHSPLGLGSHSSTTRLARASVEKSVRASARSDTFRTADVIVSTDLPPLRRDCLCEPGWLGARLGSECAAKLAWMARGRYDFLESDPSAGCRFGEMTPMCGAHTESAAALTHSPPRRLTSDQPRPVVRAISRSVAGWVGSPLQKECARRTPRSLHNGEAVNVEPVTQHSEWRQSTSAKIALQVGSRGEP